MSRKKNNVEASHHRLTCDVPRCGRVCDVLDSQELWRDGNYEPRRPEEQGWVGFPIRDRAHRYIRYVDLCPDHAGLAEHRDLVNLMAGLLLKPDEDRLPLEI